ncbi:glycosyltransferase family 4 protein [Paenibacillus sp. 481]|uniref:glycosyltransferase family 4 protein n=1 Tax=Paenibacillus sp. 481 TaxID=2835869 RepID=UPI001E65A4D3|nr:glycosyltransferase family 4 protein [Paenibacillus sp. 481]UHA71966.1 glycosyltransferase family 4 protein [Paenibacillus sp. 481]
MPFFSKVTESAIQTAIELGMKPKIKPGVKPLIEITNQIRPRIVLAVTLPECVLFFEGHIRYLREQGYEVTVVSCARPQAELLEGASFVQIPMKRYMSVFRDLASLWHACRVLHELKPDIINAGTPKAGLIMMLAGWLCRVPHRVYTCHGLRLETMKGWRRTVLAWTERLSARCAHRVIAVSDSVRAALIHLQLAPVSKVEVLHHGSCKGVEAARYAPTAERLAEAAQLRLQWGIELDAPVIGFVGRQARDKGVDLLVEAFLAVKQLYPQAILLMLGNDEETDPIEERTKRIIATEPSIKNVGFISQIEPYYTVMDMLVHPSYREGFGNVILEAGAAARPVIVSRVTGLVDSVKERVTGLFIEPGNVAQLQDAMLELLRNAAYAKQLGVNGRRRVLRDYRPAHIIAAHERLYQRMLSQSRQNKERGRQ